MSKTQYRIFFGILGLLHLAAWVYSVLYQPETKDTLEYHFAAENFLRHGNFYCLDLNDPIDMRAFSKRPALYPILISLVPRGTLLLLQNLISLLLIYLMHKKFSLSDAMETKKFMLYLLFWIFGLGQFIYANLIMADIWLQISLLTLFLLWPNSPKITPLSTWLFISLVVVASILFKPVAVFLAFFFPLFLVLYGVRNLKVFAIAFLPLLCVLSISAYNKQKTGVFEYSSISQINLLHYNTRYTLLSVYGNTEQADSVLNSVMLVSSTPAEYAQNHKLVANTCKEILLQYPLEYLYIHVKGMIQMPLDPGRFDLAVFFFGSREDGAQNMEDRNSGNSFLKRYFSGSLGPLLFLLFVLNLIKIGVFAFWLFMKSVPLIWRVSSAFLVLYVTGLTGPLGASRFMIAISPLILLSLFHLLQRKPVFKQGPES